MEVNKGKKKKEERAAEMEPGTCPGLVECVKEQQCFCPQARARADGAERARRMTAGEPENPSESELRKTQASQRARFSGMMRTSVNPDKYHRAQEYECDGCCVV